MSLKLVELQVALPKTHELGKWQEHMLQYGQLAQQQLAAEMKKQDERIRQQVTKTEQSEQAKWKKQYKKKKKANILTKEHILILSDKRDDMTTFLWMISFVLHGISLFLIILLSLKWIKIKETEKEQAELIREMETMMTTYLMQFKEENERFIKQLTSSPVRQKKKETPPSFQDEQVLLPVEQVVDRIELSTTAPKKEQSVESLVSEALKLQQQGKTIEEIAKTLKRGKTEMELLLKFHQK